MARPRQITDAQILGAMRDTVLAQGPQVSLEVVAEQLGVTSPALLKRFGSRQELMLAALRPPESPQWLELLEQGPDGRPFGQQLLEIFEAMEAFFKVTVPCMSALRESGIPWERVFPNANAKALPVRSHQALSRWLARAQQRGLVEGEGLSVAAYAMVGAIQFRAYSSHLTQQAESPRAQQQFFQQLTDLFTRALARAPRSPKPKAKP